MTHSDRSSPPYGFFLAQEGGGSIILQPRVGRQRFGFIALVRPNRWTYQTSMAKRTKSLPQERGMILFDVIFEDGSRASNRRIPMEILGGLDGDEPAREFLLKQEAEIAERAGRAPRPIKSLMRSAKPIPKPARD